MGLKWNLLTKKMRHFVFMKIKKTFTIDRNTWYRGQSYARSRLLKKNGQMCCLGQVGRQCGISDKALIHNGTPQCSDECGKFPTFLVRNGLNTATCEKLMTINDDRKTKDPEREEFIKKEFKKRGYLVTFIN